MTIDNLEHTKEFYENKFDLFCDLRALEGENAREWTPFKMFQYLYEHVVDIEEDDEYSEVPPDVAEVLNTPLEES